MVNPYGITEVDIPGVYGAVQNARMGRLQQMMANRQIDALDRQADRDNQIQTVLARLGGQTASPTGGTGGAGAVAAYGAPATVARTSGGGPTPAATAPPADNLSSGLVPISMLQELASLGPEGIQMASAFRQMNAAQLAQASGQISAITPLLIAARARPEAERRAVVDAARPDLQALGYTDEQINAFPLDDQHLDSRIALGTPVVQALTASQPDFREIEGELVNTRVLPTTTAENPVAFRSQYIRGPDGAMYPRDQVAPRPRPLPRPGEVVNGHRYRGPPPSGPADPVLRDRNNWEPVSATPTSATTPDLDIWRGAGSGPQGFP